MHRVDGARRFACCGRAVPTDERRPGTRPVEGPV